MQMQVQLLIFCIQRNTHMSALGHFSVSIIACTCMCQSEDVWACLCEHAFFSLPLTWTIACGEVLRSSQISEQCKGRRVPQMEVVHARALTQGEASGSHHWNQVKCLACRSPIWLPAMETQKGRSRGVVFTVRWVGAELIGAGPVAFSYSGLPAGGGETRGQGQNICSLRPRTMCLFCFCRFLV